MKTLALLFISLTALSACGGDPAWLPRAHKITIQQGNLLNANQVERLAVGMPRAEIRSMLGAPLVNTSFHEHRWDYFYTSTPAGQPTEAKRLSLVFEDDVLKAIDSSSFDVTGKIENRRPWWERVFAPKGNS